MKISIVIPAKNEESYIGDCLKALQTSARLLSIPVEYIVVSNMSQDRTCEIAEAMGARIVESSAKSLAAVRNEGAAAATGNILVTIDADSRASKNLLRNIVSAMQNPEILGGAVLVFPERLSLGIFLTGVLFSPFILYYGISGGVFFLRRKEWDLLRGFNERLVAFEDIDFALRLKRLAKSKGKKFKILWSSYIITSCRKFDKLGDYYYLNPLRLWRLYKQDREEANKLWYHFHDTQKR